MVTSPDHKTVLNINLTILLLFPKKCVKKSNNKKIKHQNYIYPFVWYERKAGLIVSLCGEFNLSLQTQLKWNQRKSVKTIWSCPR